MFVYTRITHPWQLFLTWFWFNSIFSCEQVILKLPFLQNQQDELIVNSYWMRFLWYPELNQGQSKCYQLSQRPKLISETLIIPDITKPEYCFSVFQTPFLSFLYMLPYLFEWVPNLELVPTSNKRPSYRQKNFISAKPHPIPLNSNKRPPPPQPPSPFQPPPRFPNWISTNKRLSRRRRFLQSIVQKPCLVTSSRFFITIYCFVAK